MKSNGKKRDETGQENEPQNSLREPALKDRPLFLFDALSLAPAPILFPCS